MCLSNDLSQWWEQEQKEQGLQKKKKWKQGCNSKGILEKRHRTAHVIIQELLEKRWKQQIGKTGTKKKSRANSGSLDGRQMLRVLPLQRRMGNKLL